MSNTQISITELFENYRAFLNRLSKKEIDELSNNFRDFLLEKNKRYGDSALNPKQVFFKDSASNGVCIRLDDKISRIENSTELRKNDICDLFGYTALLMISKGWTKFDDLLD